MLLLHLQFGGVLDGDHAFGIRNVAGEHIEQGGLAGAGSAGDQQVEPAFHHGGEQFQHGLGQGFVFDHVAGGDRIAAETPDGKAGPINRQRRNDGVHAGAVGKTRIHHRRGFIHASSHPRDNPVDDLHEVRIVLEAQSSGLKLARAFHVDSIKTVHQNVGNGWIFEQRFERAQAEDFVQNLPRQPFPLGEAERHGFAVHGIAN